MIIGRTGIKGNKGLCFIILGVLLQLVLASCAKNRQLSGIPVEYIEGKHYLDEMSDSCRYLLLDDSSIDAIVGAINKVMTDDGLLFISHFPGSTGWVSELGIQQNISVFDDNGKFVCKIGMKGRARNEYQIITTWCIDKQNKEVLIYDSYGQRIIRYTYDGTYISQIPIESKIKRLFSNNGRLYAQTRVPDPVFDDLFEIKKDGSFVSLFPKRDIGNENIGIEGTIILTDPDLKSFLHLRPYDNTLYEITGDKVDSCGHFDFIEVPTEDRLRKQFNRPIGGNQSGVVILNSDAEILFMVPRATFETTSYYIVCNYGSSDYVYSKLSGKCIGCDHITTKFDSQLLTMQIVGVSGDDVIVKIPPRQASTTLLFLDETGLLSEYDKEMLKIIADRENETLVFYHLKL